MIATMPKRQTRDESEHRSARTGTVTIATIRAIIDEYRTLADDAASLLKMMEASKITELVVDGVNLHSRGYVQCGAFLDKAKSAA